MNSSADESYKFFMEKEMLYVRNSDPQKERESWKN